MNILIWIGIALVVLALFIFPGIRKKLKVLVGGFLNVFVEDAAKTPEGANAVFSQAIEEVQTKYNQASDMLNKLSGELKHAQDRAESLAKEIQSAEASCERLVQAGQMRDAEIYASKRSELIAEMEQKKECIKRLQPMVAEATQIHDACGKRLRELQRKQKETVNKLKMNSQLKDMYDDLDSLRKDSATDKMLGAVLDGSKDLQMEVDGARVVYENKASTKLARAEQKAEELKNDEYLENLKKKYGGK